MNLIQFSDIKSGDVINDILIKERIIDDDKHPKYLCECLICGRTRIIRKEMIKSLRMVNHSDCGYQVSKTNPKDKKFYNMWRNMRMRTTNPNATEYNNYGERGISSDDYKNFVDFYDDLYELYSEHYDKFGSKNTTLDRINTNGNYSKDNIRFAIYLEQNQNLSFTQRVIATNINTGEQIIFGSKSEASKKLNVSSNVLDLRSQNIQGKINLEYDIKIEPKYKNINIDISKV